MRETEDNGKSHRNPIDGLLWPNECSVRSSTGATHLRNVSRTYSGQGQAIPVTGPLSRAVGGSRIFRRPRDGSLYSGHSLAASGRITVAVGSRHEGGIVVVTCTMGVSMVQLRKGHRIHYRSLQWSLGHR